MELSEVLARPTAVCCMEMQRGVVGDLSTVARTTEAVEADGLVPRLALLLDDARRTERPVIHCTASFRADGRGSFANMPMVEHLRAQGGHLIAGTPSTDPLPDLWDRTGDLVSERHHGIAPFTGTALETELRTRGIATVVAVGVSLNRGILGLAIEAVNRGFDVVVPTDGSVGYPAAYGRDVLEHTLRGICHLATVAEVRSAWTTAR
ncbi:MAG: cysteine hydrolase family protein [Acidimicrobiales bacterium]|nr:cysteine hydrolase family protein [Acidimicrobiales bacterium]